MYATDADTCERMVSNTYVRHGFKRMHATDAERMYAKTISGLCVEIIHEYTYTNIHIHTNTYMHTKIHMCTLTYTHMHACMHTYILT